jgi:DNA-binding MarR family transcriptional regulator
VSTRRGRNGGRAGAARHRRARAAAGAALPRIAALAALLGLDAAQWRVLAALGDGAAASLAEAVARGGIERARAVRAAQALARRGFVARTHDPFDARRPVLQLTTKGRALYRRATLLVRARERLLAAALAPGEQRELDRLLAKLARAAEKALAG